MLSRYCVVLALVLAIVGAAVVQPVLDPAPGTHFRPGLMDPAHNLTINISSATQSATIRYTTDGTTPNATHGVVGSTVVLGPFTSTTQSYQVLAVAINDTDSSVSSVMGGTYTVEWPRVDTIVFNPSSTHALIGSSNISMSTAVSGASIYWSVGFGAPTVGSSLYNSTIQRETAGEFVLRAVATAAGYRDSIVTTEYYTITHLPVATPVFVTAAGSYSDLVEVNITCATEGAEIFYYLDSHWSSYAAPVLLNQTGSYTIRARAQKPLMVQSSESESSYSVTWPQTAAPVISNATAGELVQSAGSMDVWIAAVNLTITHSSADAILHYTVDGSAPDTSSAVFDSSKPLQFSVAELNHFGVFTVRALAEEMRLHDSEVASYTFELRKDTAFAPEFSISPGVHFGTASVNLSCSTPGVTILYSTDGTTPATTFTGTAIYLSQIQTYQLRARAERSDLITSAEVTGDFQIEWRTVAYPELQPAGGFYLSSPSVDMSSSTSGANILYRLSEGFTSAVSPYGAPVDLSSVIGASADEALRRAVVVHAYGNQSGYLASPEVASAFQLVSASMPSVKPNRGSIDGSTVHTATLKYVPTADSTADVSVRILQGAVDLAATVSAVSVSDCGAEVCKSMQIEFRFADLTGVSTGAASIRVTTSSMSFDWTDYTVDSDATALVVSTLPVSLHLDQPQYVTVQVRQLLDFWGKFAAGSSFPPFSAELLLDGTVYSDLQIQLASDADEQHTFHVLCPAVSAAATGTLMMAPTGPVAGVRAFNATVQYAEHPVAITQLSPSVGSARPTELTIEVFGAVGVTASSQFTVLFNGESVSASVSWWSADKTRIRVGSTPFVANSSQVAVKVSLGAQEFGEVQYLIRMLPPTLLSVTPSSVSSSTREVVRLLVANWPDIPSCRAPCDPSPVAISFGEKGNGTVLSVVQDAALTAIEVYSPVVLEPGFGQLSITRSVDSHAVYVEDHQSLFQFYSSTAARIKSVSPGFALASGGAVVQLQLSGMGDNSGTLEFKVAGQSTVLTVAQWDTELVRASFVAPAAASGVQRVKLEVRRSGTVSWSSSILSIMHAPAAVQHVSASPPQTLTSGGIVTITVRNVPHSITALRADQLSLTFGATAASISAIHQTMDTVLLVTATVEPMAAATYTATLACSNGCSSAFSMEFSHDVVEPVPAAVFMSPLVGEAGTEVVLKLVNFPLSQSLIAQFQIGTAAAEQASIMGTPSTTGSVTTVSVAVPTLTTTADLIGAEINITTFDGSSSLSVAVQGFSYRGSSSESTAVFLTAVLPTDISPGGGQLVSVKVSNLVGQYAASDMTVMFAGTKVTASSMYSQGKISQGIYTIEFATPSMSDASVAQIAAEVQAAVVAVQVYPTAMPSKLVQFNLTLLELDELVLVSLEPSSTLITQAVQAEIIVANLPVMVVSDTIMKYERPVVRLGNQVLQQLAFEVASVSSQQSLGFKILVAVPTTNVSQVGTSIVTVSSLTYSTSTFFTYHMPEIPQIFLVDPIRVSQAGNQIIIIEASQVAPTSGSGYLIVTVAGLSNVDTDVLVPELHCTQVTMLSSLDGNLKVRAVTPDMSAFAVGKLAVQLYWSGAPQDAIGTAEMLSMYAGGGVVEPDREPQVVSTSRDGGPASGGTLLTVLVDYFAHDGVAPRECAAVKAELIAGNAEEIAVHNVAVIEAKDSALGDQVSITVLLPAHNATEATVKISLRAKPSVKLSVPYTFMESSQCADCGLVRHSQPSSGVLKGGTLVRVQLMSMSGDEAAQALSAAYNSVSLSSGWQIVSSEERNSFTWLTLKAPDLWHLGASVADQAHDVSIFHKHLNISSGALFSFTPRLKPAVQSISPEAGSLAGGSTVTITLQNVASAWLVTESLVSVTFGQQAAAMVAGSLQVAGDGLVFSVISPMSDESCSYDSINRYICVQTSGPHVVTVTLDGYVALSSFNFESITGDAIVTLSTDNGLTTGGETMSLIVTNFEPVASIADIKVVFGIILEHDRKEATVIEMHSYSSFTLVKLQTPQHIAGTFACQMFHKSNPSTNSAPFEFTFVEPAVYVSYVMPPLSRNDTTVGAFLMNYQFQNPFLVSVDAADGSLNNLLVTLLSKTQYSDGVYFTFEMPELGTNSIDLTATIQDAYYKRATFDLRYYGRDASEPHVRSVKPTQVALCGGALVTIILDDFPHTAINTTGALVRFATENVHLESAVISSTGVATVQFLSPVAAAVSNVSAVLSLMGANYNFLIGFEDQPIPQVVYVSHSQVSKHGGTIVTAKILDFKQLTSLDEVLVVYSSTVKTDGVSTVVELSTKPLSFSYDASTGYLNLAISIKAGAPGALAVSFLHKSCDASRAYMELTLTDMDLPSVIESPYYTGATGSTAGGDLLSVTLRKVAQVSSREEIQVLFDGVSASIHTVHNWSPQSTQLTLLTPPWPIISKQSAATVTVSHAQDSSTAAAFTFTYLPQALTYIKKTSVSRGPSIGGTATTITIANLPPVSSTSDLVVWFGEVAGRVLQLVSSTYEETTVIVEAPAHTEAACTVSVTANGDSSSSGTVPWQYSLRGSPVITNTSISKAATGVTGQTVRLVVSGLPDTHTLAASNLAAYIGNQAATVTRVVYASPELTVVDLEVPILHDALRADILLYMQNQGPSKGATVAFQYYDPAVPQLVHAAPLSGSVSGGTIVSIQFDEFHTFHESHSMYTVTFNSSATNDSIHATVLSSTYHNGTGTTTLMVEAPQMTDEGESLVTVTPSGSNGNVTFKFVYLSPSAPAVVSVHPPAGSITGGTLVQLRMSNAAGTLTSTDDIEVSFGSERAEVASLDCAGVPESGCFVTVISPRYHGFGDVNIALVPNGQISMTATVAYNYFQPCDQRHFCWTQQVGQVLDPVQWNYVPPVSEACDPQYCMPASRSVLNRYVSQVLPGRMAQSGNKRVVLKVHGFDISRLGSFSVLFHNGATMARDVQVTSLEQGVLLITVVVPPSRLAGNTTLTVTAVDIEEQKMLEASYPFVYDAETSEQPTLTSAKPTTGVVGAEQTILLELSNVPLETRAQDVTIMFNDTAASVEQLVMQPNPPELPTTAQVAVSVPTALLAGVYGVSIGLTRAAQGGSYGSDSTGGIMNAATEYSVLRLASSSELRVFSMVGTESFAFEYTVSEAPLKLDSLFPARGVISNNNTITVELSDIRDGAENVAVSLSQNGQNLALASAPIQYRSQLAGTGYAVLTVPEGHGMTLGASQVSVSDGNGTVSFDFTFVAASARVYRVAPGFIIQTVSTPLQIWVENWTPPATNTQLRYQICSDVNKRYPVWNVDTDLNVVVAVTPSGCTVESPPIFRMEEYQLDAWGTGGWVELWRTNVSQLSVVAPEAIVSPLKGIRRGHQELTLRTWFTAQASSASELLVTIGGQQVPVTSLVYSSSSSWTIFKVDTLPYSSAGVFDCSVQLLNTSMLPSQTSINSASFLFEFVNEPEVTTVSASSGHILGGTEILVSLSNFEATAFASELAVTFGGVASPEVTVLHADKQQRTMELKLTTPSYTAPHVVAANIQNTQYISTGTASFLFEYRPMQAALVHMAPQSASVAGGTVVNLIVRNADLSLAPTAADWHITFGSMHGTVDAITYSDNLSTLFVVTVPPAAGGQAGAVTLELQSAATYQTIIGKFVYTGPSEVVSTPSSGLTDGNTQIEITIQNYPFTNTTRDIICMFGPTPGVVDAFTWNAEQTNITVRTPRYQGSALDTRIVVDVSIFNPAAPSLAAVTSHMYYRPLSVKSAAFTPTFSHVKLALSRQADLSNMQTALAGLVSTAGSNVFCVSGGSLAYTVDLAGCPSAASQASVTPSFGMGHVAIYVGVSQQLLKNSVGQLPAGDLLLASNMLNSLDGMTVLQSQKITVEHPVAPSRPVAHILAPATVGACDSVWLDATMSTGIAPLAFRWSSANNAALNSILAETTSSRVRVGSTQLDQLDFDYQISVTVYDARGQKSDLLHHNMTKAALRVPVVGIHGAYQRHAVVTEDLLLQGYGNMSSCATQSDLVYTWTKIVGPNAVTTQYGPVLKVHANSMAPGSIYHWQLSVHSSLEPTRVATARVIVTTELVDLVVILGGAGTRQATSTSELAFDASASYDPSGQDTSICQGSSTCLWECTQMSSNTPCYHVSTGAKISLGTSSKAVVAAGSLAAGRYTFSFVLSGTNNRRARASKQIQMIETEVLQLELNPTAAVHSHKTAGMVDGVQYDLRIAPHQKLSLIAGIVNDTDRPSAVSWDWSESIHGLDLSALRGFSDLRNLVLPESALAGPQIYNFTVRATQGSASGTASIVVYVGSGPSGGSCVVSPSTGSVLHTPFGFRCAGWIDGADSTLSYSFHMRTNAGSWYAVRSLEEFNSAEFIVGEAGSIQVEARVYNKHGEYTSSSSTITVSDTLASNSTSDVSLIVEGSLADAVHRGQSAHALNILAGIGRVLDTSSCVSKTCDDANKAVAVQTSLLNTFESVLSSLIVTNHFMTEQLSMALMMVTQSCHGLSDASITQALQLLVTVAQTAQPPNQVFMTTTTAGQLLAISQNILQAVGTDRSSHTIRMLATQLSTLYHRVAKSILHQTTPGEVLGRLLSDTTGPDATDLSLNTASAHFLVQRVARSRLESPFKTPSPDAAGVGAFNLTNAVSQLLSPMSATPLSQHADGGISSAVDVFFNANSEMLPALYSGGHSAWSSLLLKARSRSYGFELSNAHEDSALIVNGPMLTFNVSAVTSAGIAECRSWDAAAGRFSMSNTDVLVVQDTAVQCAVNSTNQFFIVTEGPILCPGDCSSNGMCNHTSGICACDFAWQGDDCSTVRDCPFARGSPPCVSDVCNFTTSLHTTVNNTCNSTVVQPYCDESKWTAVGCDNFISFCPSNCSGNGYCNYTTGDCLCSGDYFDLDCSQKYCPDGCSGQGSCNYNTGICTCVQGFTGSGCGSLVSVSTEQSQVSLLAAASDICSQDKFKATVVVEQTPDGLPSLMSYCLTYENKTCMDSPSMSYQTTSWDFEAAATLPEGNYSFWLFARDPLLRTVEFDTEYYHTFEVHADVVVPVYIEGTESTTKTAGAVFEASIAASVCVNASFVSVWSWSLVDLVSGTDLLSSLPAVISTEANLMIPSGVLEPGHSYTATVSVYYQGMSSSVSTSSSTLAVLYAPLSVQIEQGSSFSLGRPDDSLFKAIVGDPDGSIDNSTLTYLWEIRKSDPPVTLDLADLGGPTTTTEALQLVGGSLRAGVVYEISVTVSKPNVANVTATTVVTVYADSMPQPRIANAPSTVFDSENVLSLFGTTTGTTEATIWSWSISPYINLDAYVDPTTGTNSSTRDIVIVSNTLTEATTYKVTLQAQAFGGAPLGTTTITIVTNAAPSGGTFEVSPSSAESLTTSVAFAASNWVDPNGPLEYKFGYYLAAVSAQEFTLRDWSQLPSFESSNLPLGQVRPLLWVRDSFHKTTKIKLGCTGAYDCANVRDINVYAAAVQGTNHAADMSAKLSEYVPGNHPASDTMLFLRAVMDVVNLDSVESSDCTSSCQSSQTDVRGSVLALMVGASSGAPASVTIEALAKVTEKSSTLDADAVNKTDIVLDTLLEVVRNGNAELPVASSTQFVDILESKLQAEHAKNLTSESSDVKVHTQISGLISQTLAAIAANVPVIMISSAKTIEVSLRKASPNALRNLEQSTSTSTVVMPADTSFLSSLVGYTPGQVFALQIVSYTPAVNPLSYSPTPTRSGLTSVSFTNETGAVVQVSGLAPSNAIAIKQKVTVPSSAPRCAYWNGTAYVKNGLFAIGLSSAVVSGSSDQIVDCRTTHMTDFALVDGCDPAIDCSGHGLCNQDSSCQCVCGYFGTDCANVHIANWSNPAASRTFSGAQNQKLHIGNDGTNGTVALMPYDGVSHTCAGAGSAPYGAYVHPLGARLVVNSLGEALLPHVSPLEAGYYTLCYCNAEKQNDPIYSHCGDDCAFHHRSESIQVIPHPVLGPISDPGTVRVVTGVSSSVRVKSGSCLHMACVHSTRSEFAVREDDLLFLSAACSLGAADSSSSTLHLDLHRPSGHDNTSFSLFIQTPDTLITAGATELQVCFATREAVNGSSDGWLAYTSITTLTVITAPRFNGGDRARMITGTAPDFIIEPGHGTGAVGIDGGDKIYFKASCSGLEESNSVNETAPFSTIQYGNNAIGPDCDAITAVAGFDPILSASSQSEECGGTVGLEYAGIDRTSAWCSTRVGVAPTTLDADLYTLIDLSNQATAHWIQMSVSPSIILGGIRTQGRSDDEMWVTEYAVAHSLDGSTWTDYEIDNTLVIFAANSDQNSVAENYVTGNVEVSHVRVFPKRWYRGIGMRIDIMGCPSRVTVQMPIDPYLTSTDVENAKQLKVCFAPRRTEGNVNSEYAELSSGLSIVPEPWHPTLYRIEDQGQVVSITFDGPGELSSARLGDFVYLHTDASKCDSVLSSYEVLSSWGPSARMRVSGAGKLERDVIMDGRVNELRQGTYAVCYATNQSRGDSPSDYTALSTQLMLQRAVVHPTVTVPMQVAMGQELVVRWNAPSGSVSKKLDWIGLFQVGDCRQNNDLTTADWTSTSEAADAPLTQNRCYKKSASVVQGLESGEVRFATELLSGKLEARYFAGDSVDGQGEVCQRLDASEGGSSVYCALEAVAESGPVLVAGGVADGIFEYEDDRDKWGGLEMACSKGRCVTGEVPDMVERPLS